MIASCLASGQALWGSAVKAISETDKNISVIPLLTKLIATPRFWLGATLYVIGTALYFVLLTKAKFFSIQFTMTGIVLLIALGVSYFLFHEEISSINLVGVFLIFVGILFVMK